MKAMILAGLLGVIPGLALAGSDGQCEQKNTDSSATREAPPPQSGTARAPAPLDSQRSSDELTAAKPRQAGDEARDVNEPAQLDRTMEPAQPEAPGLGGSGAPERPARVDSSYGKLTPPDGSNSGALVPAPSDQAQPSQQQHQQQ